MPERPRGFGTRSVHPPVPPVQDGIPIVAGLDLSTTYAFDDTESFARASRTKVGHGYVYTRWGNPTIDAFEAAVADLEGAPEAEAFATGMGAIGAVLLGMCSSGDRIAATQQLYGNTYSLITQRLPRYGIEASVADVGDLDAVARAAEGARLLYCETIGNPRIAVADIPALAEIASAAGIPLVVDSTFATPALCRPLEHGASLVLHSATKALGGHHDLMGGIVCGDPELLEPVRLAARDLGPTMSPFNAWLALRGLKTLHLRIERSDSSAAKIAETLLDHPAIEAVYHPGLPTDPSFSLCKRLLGGRGGATLAFDVRGGRSAAAAFQERLRLVLPAASLGGTHTLVVHAASVTHTQLDDDELAAAGIGPGFCRLAVGLEDPDDLIDDLVQALEVG